MVQLINENRKIGLMLTGLGIVFTFLGVLLFFDTGLLALGNILFLCGVVLLIGTRKSLRFFFSRGRWVSSIFFFFGITLVFLRFPVIGMMVESIGLFMLFRQFIPTLCSYLSSLPVIGTFLDLPGISSLVDKMSGDILPLNSRDA